MKHVTKLASLLLALVMVFALTITVSAVDNAQITAPAGSARTYDVYQIFTGDLSGNVLSNVKWGKNGTGTEGTAVDQTTLNALAAVNGKSDTEKLTEIQTYVKLDSEKFGTVSNGNSLSVPTGYYLIRDNGDNGSVGAGEAYSLYVVKIVGSTTISPKVGTVSSEKKVIDINDTTGATTGWQDSADYDIGDMVSFQLKGVVANDYANYTVYKFTFHDTQSAGLTFNADSVVVKVDGKTITSDYSVVTNGLADECTFEVRFADLKQISSVHAGSVITVEYNSTLNANATIGSAGNPNTMHLEYSNNPNDSQGSTTGKTPDDTVIVFTYKTVINKVTKNPNYDPNTEGSKAYIPLTGAAFKLEKKIKGADSAENTWQLVEEFTVDEQNPASTFEFTGLDDGTYRLTETVTPAGYNSIEPIEFTVEAVHSDGDTPALTNLTGNKVSGEIEFKTNVPGASLSADVVNNAGTVLPETGGIGTTIFYVLGGLLVLTAVVLLVTKKRMSAKA